MRACSSFAHCQKHCIFYVLTECQCCLPTLPFRSAVGRHPYQADSVRDESHASRMPSFSWIFSSGTFLVSGMIYKTHKSCRTIMTA